MVISHSAHYGGVAEESWDQFAGDLPWMNEGYPSSLSPWQVLHRARSSGKPYNVFAWNCEHFVNDCHGLRPTSPQMAATLLCAAVGIVVAARA